MAETMVITCPECKTKIRAPESSIGKKVRCKKCENVFVARVKKASAEVEDETAPDEGIKKGAPAKKKKEAEKPPPPPKKPEPEKKEEPPMKLLDEDEEEDTSKAYGMTEEDLRQRCPQCAAAMDEEGQVVCLECGFNTETRTIARRRRVKHITGQDTFMWLLPGILCVLAIIIMITYWCLHHFVFPGAFLDGWDAIYETKSRRETLADETIPGWAFIFQPWFEMWIAIIFAFISYRLGKFAFKRLILHPTPPEVELN